MSNKNSKNNTQKKNNAKIENKTVNLLQDKKKLTLVISAIALVLILVTVMLIFAFCSVKHSFEFKNGELVEKGGAVYKMVPTNYRPTSYYTDEKYAELNHPIFGKIPLYEVNETNGGWLYCIEDELLYRKSNVSLPTLEMMAPSSIILSTNGTKELSLKTTEDEDIIAKYAALVSDEANSAEDPGVEPTRTYRLSFRSETYSYLMYTVSYYEYDDDFFMIYDRTTGLYYPCDDEFYVLLQGADLETETESGNEDENENTPETGEKV